MPPLPPASYASDVSQKIKIDGTYTRLIQAALDLPWQHHPTLQQLYGTNPRISEIIKRNRLKFAGHIWRHKEELANEVILWQPTHAKRSLGRPKETSIHQLKDTGLKADDLKRAM